MCSGVFGGSGVEISCDAFGLGRDLEVRLALEEEADEDETETFEAGLVESEPLEEVLLLTLRVRVFFIVGFAMVKVFRKGVVKYSKTFCFVFLNCERLIAKFR